MHSSCRRRRRRHVLFLSLPYHHLRVVASVPSHLYYRVRLLLYHRLCVHCCLCVRCWLFPPCPSMSLIVTSVSVYVIDCCIFVRRWLLPPCPSMSLIVASESVSIYLLPLIDLPLEYSYASCTCRSCPCRSLAHHLSFPSLCRRRRRFIFLLSYYSF